MSCLDFVGNTTTTTTTSTAAPLPLARKLANKERRRAGRERHEERKEQQKYFVCPRRWRFKDPNGQRQGKRPDDGTRPFTGRTLDFHRTITVTSPSLTDDGGDADDAQDRHEQQQQHEEKEKEKGKGREREEDDDDELAVPLPQGIASGAMLLAMAQPAKTRHGRRGRRPHHGPMTDGEAFEVVEVDGRFVALDEDGWEILPDENAEGAFVLYSDIVRGIVR
ncbi:hypothetical protein BC827DRAFT_1155050 [Russula dissimulans]|nr:hypothetical protein BC827DRAFT_1155050 [Russula dissimulans]